MCLLKGAWIVTATSRALGNIDIDQAVVSTIAATIAAAKVTLIRMTPTSGRPAPPDFIFVLVLWEKCEPPHIDRRLFAGYEGAAAASLLRDCQRRNRYSDARLRRPARKGLNAPHL
jgi:hypothetical protein